MTDFMNTALWLISGGCALSKKIVRPLAPLLIVDFLGAREK